MCFSEQQIQLVGSIVLGGVAISTASTSTALFQAAVLILMIVQIYMYVKKDNNKSTSSRRRNGTESRSKCNPAINEPRIKEYAEVTVCFADIAGFTAWSSRQSPVTVVKVLEALFSEFDQYAKRHGITKVETVGDCYLSMCGAPHDDPDHAVHMADFALDMQRVARNILPGLQMRVGMHTGPIAAGVIRCFQPRFQIFGDTVNTASRMESTGQAGNIQVSEPTARLLQASKSNSIYLQRRSDLVKAKGKGLLQTYWLFDSERIPVKQHSVRTLSTKKREDLDVLCSIESRLALQPKAQSQLVRCRTIERSSCSLHQTPPPSRLMFQSRSGF